MCAGVNPFPRRFRLLRCCSCLAGGVPTCGLETPFARPAAQVPEAQRELSLATASSRRCSTRSRRITVMTSKIPGETAAPVSATRNG
jgi:hypothetical protein